MLVVLLLIHLANAVGALGLPRTANEVLYHAIIIGSAALCLTRGLRRRASERRPWLVPAADMVLWSSADLGFSAAYGMGGSPPFPNFTDGIYLCSYADQFDPVVVEAFCAVTASAPTERATATRA